MVSESFNNRRIMEEGNFMVNSSWWKEMVLLSEDWKKF